jgi:Leucine-rich repeat (LRR) protein
LSGLERIKDIEKVNNLYLSNNKIKKITSAAVSTAGSLVLIDLSSNDIEYIEAGAFSHMNNLREINLEQNPIVDDAVAMRQLNDGVSPNVQILPQNYSDISGDEINFGSGEVDYLEGDIFVFD